MAEIVGYEMLEALVSVQRLVMAGGVDGEAECTACRGRAPEKIENAFTFEELLSIQHQPGCLTALRIAAAHAALEPPP